jgi:glycosyltransferase involved in cell wall biosynthesis
MVSVIVPVYNGGQAFHQCLQALSRCETPPTEIIVVADGNLPGDVETALAFGVQPIHIAQRSGPARARNEGARAAKGDILLFLDSDVLAPADAVRRITGLFAGNSAFAAIFGSYDDTPAAAGFISQYKNLLHHYVHQNGREEASTFWAGCGAVQREVFSKLGGFDENYSRPSIEDIEFGYRLKQAGHRILLHKQLQVKHLKRWTLGSLLKSDIFDRALPWTDLILRQGALLDDLNLRPSSRLSAALACGLALSLVSAFWKPAALMVAISIALLLWILNARLYTFFYRRRGFRFMIGAVLLHWFYYLYSSAAFAAAVLRHLFRGAFSRAMRFCKAASLERP